MCVCVCARLHACEQSPSCLLCPSSSVSLFCFCLGPSLIASHRNHGCEVIKVEFLTQRFKKFGYFLTVTKDGILQFWSESFMLIDSFKLNQIPPLHNQQMWVIDMVCLHNMNLVAIASTDQKIGEPLVAALACSRPLGVMHLFALGEVCRRASCERGLPLLLSLPRVL